MKTIKAYKHPNGDIFLVFPNRDTNAGYIEVWSKNEGHSKVTIEYINESKVINGNALIARYNKIYDAEE